MKRLIIISLLIISAHAVNAQVEGYRKVSITGGWGYYELFNVGAQWNYSKRSSLSAYVGSNLGLNKNISREVGFSFDQVFLKPSEWKLKPGYSVGALLWTRNDELYYFKSISIPMMALIAYPISPSFVARLESGVIFSSVLESTRKQNVEAGFPDRINGNVRINVIYKLKRK